MRLKYPELKAMRALHSEHTLWPAAIAFLASLAAPTATASPRSFDLSHFPPYLAGWRGAAARDALTAGRFALAARHLRPLAARGPERRQAQFLLAYALYHAATTPQKKGRPSATQRTHMLRRAVGLLSTLERTYPLLGSYHRMLRARCLHRLGSQTDAVRLTATIAPTSPLFVEAIALRARAHGAAGAVLLATAAWQTYLRHSPYGPYSVEAHLRIAEGLLHAAGGVPGATSLQHLRRVAARAPLSRFGKTADAKLKELAERWPGQRAATSLTIQERFTEAHALFRAMRNGPSENAFQKLSTDPSITPEQRCRALYFQAKSIFKARQRDRAEPVFAAAANACRIAGDDSLVVKSLYNQGRGLYRKGLYNQAAEHFLGIERAFSHHSYADDARLMAAEAYEAAKAQPRAEAVLADLPRLHPKGDQAREALWRLAKLNYFKGKLDAALELVQRIERQFGHARQYFAEGRAIYWSARIRQRQGDPEAARNAYEQCIRAYPLSYYALLAASRLRESAPHRFHALWRALLPPKQRRRTRWRFPAQKIYRGVAFRSGLELARLGFGSWAEQQLRRSGITTAKGQDRQTQWLAAALFDQAGLWHLSHQVPRSRDWSWKKGYPTGDNFQRWRIAFPQAFRPIVMGESKRSAIPRALLWGVMREESGFVTHLESYANAIGLMQLILPTAKATAAPLRLKVDRPALRDPRINIRLGSAYLAFLSKIFSRNWPLVIAAYNAGHGAVLRWLRLHRARELDELVELIPYDQTRHYTKRVLASYFAYTILGPPRAPAPPIPRRWKAPRNVSR